MSEDRNLAVKSGIKLLLFWLLLDGVQAFSSPTLLAPCTERRSLGKRHMTMLKERQRVCLLVVQDTVVRSKSPDTGGIRAIFGFCSMECRPSPAAQCLHLALRGGRWAKDT